MTTADATGLLNAGTITAGIAILSFFGVLVRKMFLAAARVAVLFDRVESLEQLGPRIDEIKERLNTLWGFMLSRGIAEAINKGVAIMNSPVTVTDEAKSWFAPIEESLRRFYETEGHALLDPELAFEIEKRFGRVILTDICVPHGLYMGACLVIALQICRDSSPNVALVYPHGEDEARAPPK